MKRTARDMDVIIQQWLDEHRQRKRKSQSEIEDPQDFIDIIVSIIDAHEDQTFYGFDKDNAIKGTAMRFSLDV
ncbi:hypothetical protein RJ641_002626 [Dillenia turbinata]|uniref:Uncharacterized protein n=1 Tax=Dillenia turbinata TaxID=194707 RepID=A0AAN8V9J8_9MAGN